MTSLAAAPWLAIAGFGMVALFMLAIMRRWLSPLVALVVVPVAFALAMGVSVAALGPLLLAGVVKLAPTGIMLLFAILYFGLMIDAGLFDPLVRWMLARVGGDPLRVVGGTVLLAAVVSLDGDGSTTYMIVTAALLPLYRRLRLDALELTSLTMLTSGVMNLTPWGGPLARAATALHLETGEVFRLMWPLMAAGLAGVLALAYFVGLRERQRVGVIELAPLEPGLEEFTAQRPGRLLANAVLTSLLLCGLVMEWMPLPVLFMLAFGLAALLNYPQVDEQRARVAAHAPNALAVAGLIFAAGAFTGVLGGTGMLDAMSATALQAVPPSLGGALAPLTAAASLPLTFFLSNDAFYYGMLPVLAKAGAAYGIEPVAMARAALVGQPFHLLSPLVPSTWLLVGLAGVDFADHQRRTWLRAAAVCLLMLVAGVVAGAFPLLSRAG